MKPMGSSTWLVAVAGGLCLLVALAVTLLDPGSAVRNLREDVFDRLLIWSPRANTESPVVVIDIGRDALQDIGPWPWPRERLAELIDKIAEAKPAVLAINILLPAREPPAADPADDRLAQSITGMPTVLAMLLDPAANPDPAMPPPASFATQGEVDVPDLLRMPGVVQPEPAFAANAKGLGVISLPGAEGQPVRSVYLLAVGANSLFPGFAAETLRVAEGSSTLIASAPPQILRIGHSTLPLPPDATMRLHFTTAAARAARTVAAEALLKGNVAPERLKGKIVMLGASAPEAGGLRLTPVEPFMPSVAIEAEAVEQMLSGHVPRRADIMGVIEVMAGALLGILGILAVVQLSPTRAGVAILALSTLWVGVAAFTSTQWLLLTDPLMPVLIGLIAAQGAGLTQFARTYRQRLAIERRFAMHLTPEMVRRIVDNPGEVRFAGETRMITALMTDIEGFTALTERVGAEATISLLDRYIDTVAGIIIRHGGMVDKIVGDGLHAFFNAPLDLPDHAESAVACALAIRGATEAMRREPHLAAIGLGRTRIGIETGLAVLGDVGRGSRRDYTAYGHAVNLASRLEGMNKQLGTTVLIGPGTRDALLGRVTLRSLGRIAISGLADEIEVFEPEGS